MSCLYTVMKSYYSQKSDCFLLTATLFSENVMYLRNLWFLVLFYLSVLIKMVLKIISSPVILLIKSHIFTSCHFRLQIRKSSITCDPDSDFYFCWLLFWKHGVTLWTRNYFPLLQQQLTLVIACLLCPC